MKLVATHVVLVYGLSYDFYHLFVIVNRLEARTVLKSAVRHTRVSHAHETLGVTEKIFNSSFELLEKFKRVSKKKNNTVLLLSLFQALF